MYENNDPITRLITYGAENMPFVSHNDTDSWVIIKGFDFQSPLVSTWYTFILFIDINIDGHRWL